MSSIIINQEFNSRTAIMSQPFGIGDCIFSQGIAQSFIALGYDVIWPVYPQFVEALQFAYPEIKWMPYELFDRKIFDIKDFRKYGESLIIPIRWAESIMGRPYEMHMKSKYDLCDLDWKEWEKPAVPVGDYIKQKEIFNTLGLRDGEEYNLIQSSFGSDARQQVKINVNNGLRNIYMQPIPGYSVFDWMYVITWATTIHAVSTSTLYLFELLDLKAKEIHLYPRKPIEKDFKYVKFLFTKDYILHK